MTRLKKNRSGDRLTLVVSSPIFHLVSPVQRLENQYIDRRGGHFLWLGEEEGFPYSGGHAVVALGHSIHHHCGDRPIINQVGIFTLH